MSAEGWPGSYLTRKAEVSGLTRPSAGSNLLQLTDLPRYARESLNLYGLNVSTSLLAGAIAIGIFGTLAAIFGAFVHSAVLHLVLMMLSGARARFEATFRLTCYAQGSLALVNVIPCVASRSTCGVRIVGCP